jgi:hypothetical protein
MAFQSSRQRKGINGNPEKTNLLLRNGAVIQPPLSDILVEAKRLEDLGLLKTHLLEYVLCANPQDRDYPPRNRHCQGRIYLDNELDEGGYEYRCLECERPVFPIQKRKQRYKELQVKVLPQGVKNYILDQLGKLKVNLKEITGGVYRVDVTDLGVIVCIVDSCEDPKYLTRDWAGNNPTCYIVTNPKDFKECLLNEEWLCRVSLADLASGQKDIETILHKASAALPQTMLKASVPVYTKGSLPIIPEPVSPPQKGRRFVVEVGSNIVRVECEIVVAPQAGIRFQIFRILWDQFFSDLKEGLPPQEFSPINLKKFKEIFYERFNQYLEDDVSLRKAINRLQTDIETTVKKKLGSAIDREDIIQTSPYQGGGKNNYGYRLNPFTVAIRPFQS